MKLSTLITFLVLSISNCCMSQDIKAFYPNKPIVNIIDKEEIECIDSDKTPIVINNSQYLFDPESLDEDEIIDLQIIRVQSKSNEHEFKTPYVSITVSDSVYKKYKSVDKICNKYHNYDQESAVYMINGKLLTNKADKTTLRVDKISSITVYTHESFQDILNPKSLTILDINTKPLTLDSSLPLIEIKKPVIYFYSEKEVNANIKVDVNGKMTVSHPLYKNDGWNIKVLSNGLIKDKNTNRNHDYIYWEGAIEKTFQFTTGYVIPRDSSIIFLEKILSEYGLNEIEANDFISYWLPDLMRNEYNLIQFAINNECDSFAKMSITPKPDSELRIYMLFKGCEANHPSSEQKIISFERKGFTIVEWGGINYDEVSK